MIPLWLILDNNMAKTRTLLDKVNRHIEKNLPDPDSESSFDVMELPIADAINLDDELCPECNSVVELKEIYSYPFQYMSLKYECITCDLYWILDYKLYNAKARRAEFYRIENNR